MGHLQTLLEQRNHCLNNILNLSNTLLYFLNLNQISYIETYQVKRNHLFDKFVNLENELNKMEHVENYSYLSERNRLLSEILKADSLILSAIESAKRATLEKIHQLNQGRRLISSYKSPTHKIQTAETNDPQT